MRHRRGHILGLFLIAAFTLPIAAKLHEDRADLDAIAKIKDEGLQRSEVMEITSYLTDVHGPRLTGSPNIRAAAQWVTKKMTEWGLSNVKLETWGPFGRGWTNQRFYAAMVTPYPYTLIGYSKAWTPGTNGPIKGEAVLAIVNIQDDIEKYRGKLRGKFVLSAAPRQLAAM